jgi:tRNA pseudouridine13 synthase
MLNLNVEQWRHLHQGPLFKAQIKTQLSDFKVLETLSFEPSGDGEHTFLHIEKTGLNTAYVAEEIAKFAKLPLRAVSYAGRKDKFATTSQWFGIYFGGKQGKGAVVPDWQTLSIPGVRILDITKNQRKLRTGAIAHNGFEIILRNLRNLETDKLFTGNEI